MLTGLFKVTHNLSLKVVFLFQSFLVITVSKKTSFPVYKSVKHVENISLSLMHQLLTFTEGPEMKKNNVQQENQTYLIHL